eukprot:1137064-Pelagomonas_calceolata.AAC.2
MNIQAARQGSLELRGVQFSYPVRPDTPVLNNLDLVLPRGSVTALVGRSGSGKSTIAALLSRYREGREGAGWCVGKGRGEGTESIAQVILGGA